MLCILLYGRFIYVLFKLILEDGYTGELLKLVLEDELSFGKCFLSDEELWFLIIGTERAIKINEIIKNSNPSKYSPSWREIILMTSNTIKKKTTFFINVSKCQLNF